MLDFLDSCGAIYHPLFFKKSEDFVLLTATCVSLLTAKARGQSAGLRQFEMTSKYYSVHLMSLRKDT